MNEIREDTVRDVRSVLLTVKGSIDLKQLAADFVTCVGRPIPYAQLGYDSVEAFVRSVDSLHVTTVSTVDGATRTLVDAKPSALSAHVSQMVARQKQPALHHYRSSNNNNNNNKKKKKPRPPATTQSRAQQLIATPAAATGERVVPAATAATAGRTHNRDEFFESGNAEKDLWNFLRFHRIAGEPETLVKERKSKPHKSSQYDCVIKVDGTSFSSYPTDCYDERTAIAAASKVVLEKLLVKYGRARKQCIPSTSSEPEVVERVMTLARQHCNGVWSWQIEADYKDLHQERLPADWLTIVTRSPVLNVQSFGDDKCVVQFCLPEEKGKCVAELQCDVSIPSGVAVFDAAGRLPAVVVHPVSAGEIWCRPAAATTAATTNAIGCGEAFARALNAHYDGIYESGGQAAIQIVEGGFYVAWDVQWYRVKALCVRANEPNVECFFVDRGIELSVPRANIFELQREFAREKAQAFACRLMELEDFYEVSSYCERILELAEQHVIIECCASSDSSESHVPPVPSVRLYEPDSGKLINAELMLSLAIANASHVIDAECETIEAHVSHVGSNCAFYIQIRSAGYWKFIALMAELEQSLVTRRLKLPPAHVTRANSANLTYLAKIDEDACHHRVRIIDSPPNFQYAQLLYIDTGNTRIVKMADTCLYLVAAAHPDLDRFPPQALHVKLYSDHSDHVGPCDDVFVAMMPAKDDTVLVRVVAMEEGVPLVKLFVRHGNVLVSINDHLVTQNSTKQRASAQAQAPVVVPASPVSPNGGGVPSTGVLSAPELPQPRQFYEVRIPFAVSPWNFFVQPRHSSVQLADLMARLQITFADCNRLQPIALESINAGAIYAARYENASPAPSDSSDSPDSPQLQWYRVCVLKTIYPSAIVVFYVDYGYYANLNSNQKLYPLDEQFLELPYQAIKAKLAGIKPREEKWSVEDCKYFQKLVEKRDYISVLMNVENDEFYPCDTVLLLKLIDTQSSANDVVIGDLLIHKKIAISN